MSEAAPAPEGYPVMLQVAGLACLIVGGGRIATQKAAGLHRAGAVVHVVAPIVDDELSAFAGAVRRRRFREGDCVGYRYVVAATGDESVDAEVARDAEQAGAWVNAVDRPALCSVTLPAVLRRDPITVAVSTGGASPALAAWLRDQIAAVVTERHAEIARVLAGERAAVKAAGGSTEGLDWRERIETLVSEFECVPEGVSR